MSDSQEVLLHVQYCVHCVQRPFSRGTLMFFCLAFSFSDS